MKKLIFMAAVAAFFYSCDTNCEEDCTNESSLCFTLDSNDFRLQANPEETYFYYESGDTLFLNNGYSLNNEADTVYCTEPLYNGVRLDSTMVFHPGGNDPEMELRVDYGMEIKECCSDIHIDMVRLGGDTLQSENGIYSFRLSN